MLIPDTNNMTHLECRLFSLLQREGSLPWLGSCGGKISIKAFEVDPALHTMLMMWISNLDLCKHFRDMIVLEEYETVSLAKKELEARGYRIEILENSIKFIPV